MSERALSDTQRRLSLAAAIIAISIVGASFGHTLPFFAIRQESLGASASFIGINAAMTALAAIITAPFLPRLMQRVGMRAFTLASFVTIAAGIVGIFFADATLWLWFPFRFLIGIGGAGAWIASELWILTLAPPERRGAVLGLYATSLAAGFAFGPIALEFTGYDGATPFAAPLLMLALASVFVAMATAPDIDRTSSPAPMARLFPQAPSIFGAAIVFAIAEASVMATGPIYALMLGHAQSAAGRIVVAYGLGTVALQILIGRLSDAVSPRLVLQVCAAAGLGGALLLPVIGDSLAGLYVLVFFWGGAIVGLYTVGLNMLGGRFTGADLAAGNAGMVFCYNIGALAGPIVTGLALDQLGANGLPVTLAAAFLIYVVILTLRGPAAAS